LRGFGLATCVAEDILRYEVRRRKEEILRLEESSVTMKRSNAREISIGVDLQSDVYAAKKPRLLVKGDEALLREQIRYGLLLCNDVHLLEDFTL
jgi:hypothetical protein